MEQKQLLLSSNQIIHDRSTLSYCNSPFIITAKRVLVAIRIFHPSLAGGKDNSITAKPIILEELL